MLPVTIENAAVRIGPRFAVTFQRTLRVPEDSRAHPLPPGLGRLSLFPVDDCVDWIPSSWRSPHSFFVPMYQREALWLGFHGAAWKPNAVKIAVDGINVLTGNLADTALRGQLQDYLVCPNQPWLDGIHTENRTVRQFVAMPLGPVVSANKSQRGDLQHSEIQITVFEPKAGRFPDRAPDAAGFPPPPAFQTPEREPLTGLGVGGRISQQISPDPYGPDTWDTGNRGLITVHIVNSSDFRKLTGLPPPPTPIDSGTYLRYGLPWFDRYDEQEADRTAGARFFGGAPIDAIDRAFAQRGRRAPEPVVRHERTDEMAPHAEDIDEDESRTA